MRQGKVFDGHLLHAFLHHLRHTVCCVVEECPCVGASHNGSSRREGNSIFQPLYVCVWVVTILFCTN